MEKICVAIRIRPPVNEESINGTFWKVDDNRISLHRRQGTPISGVSFGFDHVFDQSCTNARVYRLLTKDIIHAAVEGFNGTAFAYGQTSSGKTFTMNGSKSDPGIIHQAIQDIFEKIHMTKEREFLIRVSYLEIYNEEINDLFGVENQKLQIHESLERGVYVSGLREEIVNDAEQVLKLIESGEVNRHFGETNMNVRSSRSHTIFRMVIESKGKGSNPSDEYSSADAVRVSVLNLVDLAGSERIAKTGADGVRLKEGKHINKSLMILGNVINKLSEGGKQRGHIPYRDSKLTRILQPALGGNAKTSIICTVAPEEVHVEETRGTLQFASRAKRITNCAQVNEILTDAALLKRQKLEIEDLRNKLQGSRAEVLEQEVLKLRNDMLKYELEHDKLAQELEEERKSHKERDQCIRDQQMKIDNLSSLFDSSGDRNSSLGPNSVTQKYTDESSDSHDRSQEYALETPCVKAVPSAFVARRSNYSRLADFSPLPAAFNNMADEDTWLKMNNGYIADLDSIQMTPARRVQSFPPIDASPGCSNEEYKLQVLDLKMQLQLAIEEKSELQQTYTQQVLLNNQLASEISELNQAALFVHEIPQRLRESVANCKDIYMDVISNMKSFVADEKSSAPKLISSTSEIVGMSLLSTLETDLSTAIDGHITSTQKDLIIQGHHKALRDSLNTTIKSLVLSETQTIQDENSGNTLCSCKFKGCDLGGDVASYQELGNELDTMKEKYQSLQKELDINNQHFESCKASYHSLEKALHLLKDERETLLQTASKSTQKLAAMSDQREKALKDLHVEVERRKGLEEQIKEVSIAFASRQRKLMSFHNDFKSKVENLRAQNLVSMPKSLGY